MTREITKQETREAILDAAERLLARYGYSKMTMGELAEETGIGVGTTYLHFPGKAEVALGVVDRANARVVEQLRMAAASDCPLVPKLREMLIMRISLRYEVSRRNRHRGEEFKTAIGQQTAIQEIRARWFDVEVTLLAKVLQEGRELGILEFDDAWLTAQTLLWAMEALMPRNLKQPDYEDSEAFREKTERIAELLLRSLRPLDTKI